MTWEHVQDLINHKASNPIMPYRTMIELLQQKLKTTRKEGEREQIETDLVILTGILEMQAKLDKIMKHLGTDKR